MANSFKEGGRCIAGIELDRNNDPIISNGKPIWIRPVHSIGHGQIPNHIAEPFQILDIVEVDIIRLKPDGYQSENVIFDENSLRCDSNFS